MPVSSGRSLAVLCLLGLFVALGLGGCSSSTDPGGEDPPATKIVFTPTSQGQAIKLSETLSFNASVNPSGPLAVTWTRKGLVVGSGPTYNFKPTAVGPDTLRVSAESGAVTRDYYWVVTVSDDPAAIPPEVFNVRVDAGDLPSEVLVSWNRVVGSTFPIAEYLVAFRSDGPVTEENWEDSSHLEGVLASPGQVGYSTLADSTMGMIPGAQMYFAVRARDTIDQLSNISREYSHTVTWPWWIEGRILVDNGGPPPEPIIVFSLDPNYSSNTTGQGEFTLGPFRNIDFIRIQTTSSNASPGGWYDYQSGYRTAEDGFMEIVLIGRYGTDPACRPLVNPTGDFLTYLRWMTFTQPDTDEPKNSILHRWDTLPLSVYIPEFLNGAGVQMDVAAAQALTIWNAEMGAEYFTPVGDPGMADVVFAFQPTAGFDGKVVLLEPSEPGDTLARVVPEKVEVRVDSDRTSSEQVVTEISLHELGHVLGLWNHATGEGCDSPEYLMGLTAFGALDRIEPIHVDERRAIRTIKNLPQGIDMTQYLDGK